LEDARPLSVVAAYLDSLSDEKLIATEHISSDENRNRNEVKNVALNVLLGTAVAAENHESRWAIGDFEQWKQVRLWLKPHARTTTS
jgi:hypothetical protein